jgi:hypothetical protein
MTQGWRWDASLKAAADARYVTILRVRDTDADLQRIANARGARTEAMLQFQRERAYAIQQSITQALAGLPQCVVPGAVVGLLNDATRADPGPESARAAGEPRAPEPAAAPARPALADSTAATELAICARNYVDVCTPNAIERDELRRLYNEIRAKINGPP